MFEHIECCTDLSDEDAEAACASREAFQALLERLGEVSAPGTGCAIVLVAFVHLTSGELDWVDGDIAIELVDDDDMTEVRVMTELGAGMRELLVPPVRLAAPLSEFRTALTDEPALAGMLNVNQRSWKRVTLDASAGQRRSTRPPRIADTSLVRTSNSRPVKRPTAPAAREDVEAAREEPEAELDGGWDD